MKIDVVKVLIEEKPILINLLKMYCYEWSQYNKFDVNQNGEYEFEHQISSYWEKENHHPFFVKVNGVLAGFVLVDDEFQYINSDYAMAEFFIMHKYRRGGVGRYVANVMFDKFQGKWEIGRHPHNITSANFWNNIVDEYTKGKYEIIKSCTDVVYHDGTCADIISFEN